MSIIGPPDQALWHITRVSLKSGTTTIVEVVGCRTIGNGYQFLHVLIHDRTADGCSLIHVHNKNGPQEPYSVQQTSLQGSIDPSQATSTSYLGRSPVYIAFVLYSPPIYYDHHHAAARHGSGHIKHVVPRDPPVKVITSNFLRA